MYVVIEFTGHVDKPILRYRHVARSGSPGQFRNNAQFAERTVRPKIKAPQFIGSQVRDNHVFAVRRHDRAVSVWGALTIFIGSASLMIMDGKTHLSRVVPRRFALFSQGQVRHGTVAVGRDDQTITLGAEFQMARTARARWHIGI